MIIVIMTMKIMMTIRTPVSVVMNMIEDHDDYDDYPITPVAMNIVKDHDDQQALSP